MNKLRSALTGVLLIPTLLAVARHSTGKQSHHIPSTQKQNNSSAAGGWYPPKRS
jgi:hypothetical protein